MEGESGGDSVVIVVIMACRKAEGGASIFKAAKDRVIQRSFSSNKQKRDSKQNPCKANVVDR